MSSAFPVTGCVYCKHKHTHLSHTCLAPSHPHSYPYPHTQTQTDTPGKLSARPRQSPRDAPRGGWGREGVVFPSIVKQRGTWILMLQPSSGMSALSLPRISQLSSCPEPFLQGWPRQCSVSALSRFLLNGEAQSWEMFLKKGSAILRSGCCMGVALFWFLHRMGLNLPPLSVICTYLFWIVASVGWHFPGIMAGCQCESPPLSCFYCNDLHLFISKTRFSSLIKIREFAELHRKMKSHPIQSLTDGFRHFSIICSWFYYPANPLFLAHYLICINIFVRFQVLLLLYSLFTGSSNLIGCCILFNGTKFFSTPWIQRAVG